MNALMKERITDSEIAQVKTMREMVKVLKQKLDKMEAELEVNEKTIIELVESGVSIDTTFNISIVETSRKHPKYKEEIEKRLGEDVLNEIIESTHPKITKKLIIPA